MKRHPLGNFEVPSGGEVDVYISQAPDGPWELFCEWPTFPLPEADRLYYTNHLMPILAKRIKEKLGTEGGKVLWLNL